MLYDEQFLIQKLFLKILQHAYKNTPLVQQHNILILKSEKTRTIILHIICCVGGSILQGWLLTRCHTI